MFATNAFNSKVVNAEGKLNGMVQMFPKTGDELTLHMSCLWRCFLAVHLQADTPGVIGTFLGVTTRKTMPLALIYCKACAH